MEEPQLQTASQTYGYNMSNSHPAVVQKNPFVSTSSLQISPTKSGPSQLRWHNSVAEDFSPIMEVSTGLKRTSSFALTDDGSHHYPTSLPEHEMPSTHTVSIPPNKKRKTSVHSSVISTPVKAKIGNDGPFDPSIISSSSGIQTPPPSNPTGKKRRGRPPKNPQGTSTARPPVPKHQNLIDREQSQEGTPSKAATYMSHASPIMQQLDNYLSYSNPVPQMPNNMPHIPVDFSPSGFWDNALAVTGGADSTPIAANMASFTGDIDIMAATVNFDWSMLPTTVEDMASLQSMDPLRPVSMHSMSQIPFGTSMNSDAINFSFMQESMPPHDMISPVLVDPNLIFTGPNLLRGTTDNDLGLFEPYRQQSLQQQQEKLEVQQKKQTKQTNGKAQYHIPVKATTSSAPARPALRRALTESVLTKSASKTKSHVSKKMPISVKEGTKVSVQQPRSVVRDENTTPSPTIAASSTRNGSPSRSSVHRSGPKKIKTAVSFTISPSGRAKAETVVVKDIDSQSEGANSDDQGEGYQTDSSTDSDDMGPPKNSRAISARRLAKGKHRRNRSSVSSFDGKSRPKLARFNTTPSGDKSGSQFLLSCDFSSDSFGYGNNPFISDPSPVSRRRAQSLKKKSSSEINRSFRRESNSSFHSTKSAGLETNLPALGSMREEDDDHSEAETVIDVPIISSPGDAIQALKKAVANRQSFSFEGLSKTTQIKSGPRNYKNQSNAIHSSPHHQTSQGLSTPQTVRSGYSTDTFNISPTTVTDPECVTPSSYAGKHDMGYSFGLRCRCESTGSNDMPIMQCNACYHWLHARCEGFVRIPIPHTFVCSFCKGSWRAANLQTSQKVFKRPPLPQPSSPVAIRSFHL